MAAEISDTLQAVVVLEVVLELQILSGLAACLLREAPLQKRLATRRENRI